MFGIFGIAQTSWMGRLPSIRAALDISDGSLGLILTVAAVGALVGVTLVTSVIMRLGSATTMRISMIGSLLGFTAMGIGTALGSVSLFTLGLMTNTLVTPGTNVPINLEAARVEKPLGKAILPQVHAAFSVGALIGAGLAAGTSALSIHPAWHVIGVIALVTVGRFFLIAPGCELQLAPTRQGGATSMTRQRGGVARALGERRTVLLGLVILAATMSEGSAANWLNIAVTDSFQIREFIGAMAYGTFVVSMLTVRLLGTGLLKRFGRVAVLRLSGVSALAGLLLFGLAPNLALAWVGIVFWGAGAAMAWPIGTSAAADDPNRAAARVSVVNSFASMASIMFPPVLGLLADTWGIRNALLLITGTMVLSIVVAGQARPERRAATELCAD